MTRRGRRSLRGHLMHARPSRSGKIVAASWSSSEYWFQSYLVGLGKVNAEIAYDQRHDERRTVISAHCRACGHFRFDIPDQRVNARHPDGRLRAEAIMLAVAWYQSCHHCGATGIDLMTIRELAARRRCRR